MKKWEVAIMIGAICLMLDWGAWQSTKVAIGLVWVLTTFGGFV